MKRLNLRPLLLAAALCGAFALAPAHAVEINGIKLEDNVKVGGKDIKLNGAGVRIRAVFKVYVLGLYLDKKETTTAEILANKGPRRFHIVMLRDVSGEDFGQTVMTGINANTDKAEKGKIVNQIINFGEVFVAVGGLKKGDVLTGDWIPDKGTVIELNGKAISETIPDVGFYNALLKIWLGDKPADSSLKPLLLGGSA